MEKQKGKIKEKMFICILKLFGIIKNFLSCPQNLEFTGYLIKFVFFWI